MNSIPMHRNLLIVVLITLLFACSKQASDANTEENTTGLSAIPESKAVNPDKLEFSYFTDTIYPCMDGNIIELSCKLSNGNTDTLYFYTQSCFGWEHNFLFDTDGMRIHSMIDCNVSNPIIKKVGPESDFTFKGRFYVEDRKLKNIQVDYYIYQVRSDFDVWNSELVRKLEKTVVKSAQNMLPDR